MSNLVRHRESAENRCLSKIFDMKVRERRPLRRATKHRNSGAEMAQDGTILEISEEP